MPCFQPSRTPSSPPIDGTHTFSATLETAGHSVDHRPPTRRTTSAAPRRASRCRPPAAQSFEVTGFPTNPTAGDGRQPHGHRLRRLWQRGHRLQGHGGSCEQRRPRRSARRATPSLRPTRGRTPSRSRSRPPARSRSRPPTRRHRASRAPSRHRRASAAAAKTLTVAGFPTTTRRARPAVMVTAYDAYGNVATGYTGTVAL